jgi:hypothetical protein
VDRRTEGQQFIKVHAYTSVPARKFGQRGTIIEKRATMRVLAESKGHTLYILGEIMVMLFYFLASNSISMQIQLYTGF